MIEIGFTDPKNGKEEKKEECLTKLTDVVENIEKKADELDKTKEGEKEFANKCKDLHNYLNSYIEEQEECPKKDFPDVYWTIESVIKEALKKYKNYRNCPEQSEEIIKEQIKLDLETDELCNEGSHCKNKVTKSEEEEEEDSLKTKHDGELEVEKLGKGQELSSASTGKQEPARKEYDSESSKDSQPVNGAEQPVSGAFKDEPTAHDSLETERVKLSDSSLPDPNRVNVLESDLTKSLQDISGNNHVSCEKTDACALKNNEVSVTDPSVSVSSSPKSCTTSSPPCPLNVVTSTPGAHHTTGQDITPKVNGTAPANTPSVVCQVLGIRHLLHKGHVMKKVHLVEKMNILKQMEFMRLILEVNTVKGEKLKLKYI
ncbi:hypothetical protein PVBG_05532 [Plasmodium vivax Brazil I]|uniref:Uncharacterized protein n=1 Tax=Plasmodium vivax (strain Brazil I) TaxID=1033975 RepID=A0A0J9VHH2_PLAV1|nr:hypothetical protein PVBG_05532 [Plasmodium vivax Brazil I]